MTKVIIRRRKTHNSSFFGSRHFGGGKRFGQGRKIQQIDPALLIKKSQGSFVQEDYKPQHSFDDLSIQDTIKQNIKNHGYTVLTPIQDQAIPHILSGRDLVGIANTGTGKTAAFLIPLIHKILTKEMEKVLIVAPTRELAVQILNECKSFSQGVNIFPVLLIGGVSTYQQIQGLRRNPNIVIGTPGRIKDLKTQGKLQIASFNNIVLDEVDRMLDMGFIHDVRFIISHLPKMRQSLFFSATVAPVIKNIIDTFARNPMVVSVKLQEIPLNVDQDIVKMNGRAKIDVLHDLLIQEGFDKVLVFGRTKWGIEKLARQLTDRGFQVAALHGNKNQNQRQRALEQFKNNNIKILLGTDIVSRGIDVTDVTHVINYDLPETYDDYIHRIGRTGRAGKKGMAFSFVD